MVRFSWVTRSIRKSCTYRLNTKLENNGYPAMSSLVKDLSDGVRLIQLMVSKPSERSLGYHVN
jgi:hypothetical protein